VLAMSQTFLGDAAGYKIKLERERSATPAQIQAAAKRWLSDGEYILEVRPFGDPKVSANPADRNAPPATAEPPQLKLPKLERTTLSSGLKLVLAERHEIPLVNFELLVDAGYAADQFAAPGTAALAASLLDQGTKTRSSLEISEQLAQLGANLGVGSSLDTTRVRLSSVKDKLDASLEIYADAVLNPSFPQSDFAREQKQQLSAIEREKSEPNAMAMRVVPALLYGKGHAYAEPWTGSGTPESVAKITREEMVKFHGTWFKPGNATLIIVGDTTMVEIKPKIERLFASWKPGDTPRKNIAAVSMPQRPVVYLVDKPGAEQSVIMAANLAPPKNNPEEIAIESMNNILGGDFGARINMNLREDKHWSYGSQSLIPGAKGQRPFLVYAPVEAGKTRESLLEVQKELSSFLAAHPATAEELMRVQTSQTLRLPGSRETIDQVTRSIAELVEYNLPENYHETYAGKVRALTLADIGKSAGVVVHPDKLVWVVVGDRARIESGIRELGLGEVRILNPE
jgi:zinc protease